MDANGKLNQHSLSAVRSIYFNLDVYCGVSRHCLLKKKYCIPHHIACTDTGLKTCVRPAVFTVKPLRSKQTTLSFAANIALCVSY